MSAGYEAGIQGSRYHHPQRPDTASPAPGLNMGVKLTSPLA